MSPIPAPSSLVAARRRHGSRPPSGLYYYGYRYLDTQLGRWLSRDPLGLRGGLNLYAFVSNLASSKIDIVGLRPGDEVTNCKKTGGWRLDQRIVEPNFLLKRNGVSVSRFYFVCSCEEICCVWNKYSGVEGKRKFWIKVWEDDEKMYFRCEDQEILAGQISKIAQSVDNTNANRDSPISIPETVRDTIHNPPTSPGDLEGRQKELDEHFRKRDEWRKQHNEKWQKMKDQCKASCGRDKNGWDETTYAIFAEVIVGNQVVERNPFTGNRDGTARDLTPNEMDENSKVKRR